MAGGGASNTVTAEWCSEIVQDAVAVQDAPDVINADQGRPFISEAFTKLLTDNNLQIGTDSKGRAIDNIFIERLWCSVKYEPICLHAYEDGLSLYKGLQRYFSFYNGERHRSLNYETPLDLYCRAA